MAVLVPMVSKKSTSSTADEEREQVERERSAQVRLPDGVEARDRQPGATGSEATPAMSDTKVPKPIPIRIEPFTRRAISAAITSRLARAIAVSGWRSDPKVTGGSATFAAGREHLDGSGRHDHHPCIHQSDEGDEEADPDADCPP